jgi:hypothetical protein
MAEMIFDPVEKKEVECIKKGTNSSGDQIWMNKETKKRFSQTQSDEALKEYSGSKKVKKTPSKGLTQKAPVEKTKPAVKSSGKSPVIKNETVEKKEPPKPKKMTNIYVNNEKVKSIDKELTAEDAFNYVTDYYREVSAKNSTVKVEGDTTNIYFIIRTGTKG